MCLCLGLANISRDSLWMGLNRLTPTLWRAVMVYEISSRASVLHLSTSGWRWAPRSASIIPSGPHLWRAGGLQCHLHKMLTQTEQPHRTAKWPVNSDTTVTQCFSNGCFKQKVACNALLLGSWRNRSHLFWSNFPNSCKYVLESIRPNNIQSLEDSHQSS